jgi:rare lipoprotein A
MIAYPKLCNLQLAIYIVLSLFLLSCAAPEKTPWPLPGYPKAYKIGKDWYQPLKHARDFRERGMASWYGKDFHGRKTSSGETYNMYAMTAAHKTLPLETYVSVRNLNNGKRANVRINDRGPFVRGRIIDLSYEAAQRIGLVEPGTAPVEIVALGLLKESVVDGKVQQTLVPGDYYSGNFAIQVGAFKSKENAVTLRNKLAQIYDNAHIVVYEGAEGTFYRVRVARCKTLDQARKYEKKIEGAGYPDAIVVAR